MERNKFSWKTKPYNLRNMSLIFKRTVEFSPKKGIQLKESFK